MDAIVAQAYGRRVCGHFVVEDGEVYVRACIVKQKPAKLQIHYLMGSTAGYVKASDLRKLGLLKHVE